MLIIKKQLIIFLLSFIIIIPIILIYAFLLYFNKVSTNNSTIDLFSFLIGLFYFLILGLFSGRSYQNKGILVGLISYLIIMIIISIILLINHTTLTFKDCLKYVAFLLISMFGGIIGVNSKQMTNKVKRKSRK